MKNHSSSAPIFAAQTADYRFPLVFMAMLAGMILLMVNPEAFYCLLFISALVTYSWVSSPDEEISGRTERNPDEEIGNRAETNMLMQNAATRRLPEADRRVFARRAA